jgi:hypothetical protein
VLSRKGEFHHEPLRAIKPWAFSQALTLLRAVSKIRWKSVEKAKK